MHADIGNVEYDDLAALYPGAIYPGILKSEDFFASEDYDTDFQGGDPDADQDSDLMEDAGSKTASPLRQRSLQTRSGNEKTQFVTDKASGKLRPMRYRDVVILLRSPGSMAESMIAVLKKTAYRLCGK